MSAAPAPRPSRAAIAELRSFAITGLFVLAVFYTLHLGKEFFLPIALALFLAMLLRPVVQWLRRLRVPAALAPLLVLGLLVAGAGAGLYQAWEPASDWVDRAPRDLRNLESKVRKLLRPVQNVTRTAQQVDQIAEVTGTTAAPTVEVKHASISATIFGGAKDVAAGALIVLVLSYFFLASGDQFMRKLPRVLPRQHAERMVAIVGETESQISRYLLAVTLINLAVGCITAGIMAALGMPTPLLLGVIAAVFNYVPYFGPAVMSALLAMIALISFDEPSKALIAPALYLCVHAVETNFATPHLLGRRLPLNPLAIFLGFLFWWWIWGVAGAALAVPILVAIKIVADKTESLAGVGEFLGR
ncbi:MAG: AI-2E family transporter [Gemmatimonadales bacterium]